ncbi:MAG TPA: hypothetical protein VFE13_21150 [Caulobacteraceae bacterium]|nr:hypothetical protein [Caulobacteraceae bacterium]
MTHTLPRDRFKAARDFVETQGRSLDRALLRHRLGEGSAEEVMVALIAFQNPDGGFGHGLEPDTRSPASSGIASSIGLRLLARLEAPAKHPTVTGAIEWVAGALDREAGVWPIVGPGVEAAPHAPWWGWSEDLAANWNGFRFNPSAEILAHLYHYREAVPAEVLTSAEEGVARSLAEIELLDGAYDLKCAIRLAESDGLPAASAKRLDALVRRSIEAHDPADDHASPFDAAATPASRFADMVERRIEPALTGLIGSQADDGGWRWNPEWAWGFVDKKAWADAHRDWRGWITRENLETLLAYGRVQT